MLIKKTSQYIEGGASLSNVYGTSDSNGYTQEYVNNLVDLLQTNKTKAPTSRDCLQITDDTTKGVNLDYNPINPPEANQMVMWKCFKTDNTAVDSYWTYIVIALTLDDHKMWLNAYHNATSAWIGWQQF